MAQGRDVTALECEAWTIEPGDIIANLGVVTARTQIGVFYVFGVRGTVRRLHDGRMDIGTYDVVRHSHETVTIEREPGR